MHTVLTSRNTIAVFVPLVLGLAGVLAFPIWWLSLGLGLVTVGLATNLMRRGASSPWLRAAAFIGGCACVIGAITGLFLTPMR